MSSQPPVDPKSWSTLRARAAVVGMLAYRTDERDGSVVFITIVPSTPPRMQMHPDLAGVRARIEDLEAE